MPTEHLPYSGFENIEPATSEEENPKYASDFCPGRVILAVACTSDANAWTDQAAILTCQVQGHQFARSLPDSRA
eukprot:SAG31_NODE_2874_length_4971_cov_9.677750_2_plen_74_part_00